jgi:hypothetical protein
MSNEQSLAIALQLERRHKSIARAKALYILSGFVLAGILSSISYSFYTHLPKFAIATIIVGFAAVVTGGLMGFLFGIPKTNQLESSGYYSNGDRRKDVGIQYQFNTNLEQISDWLTKILIGVGLTQVHQIGNSLYTAAVILVKDLGIKGEGAAPVLTVSTIYFLVCGFLIGYLWTRLFYHRLLANADRGVLDTLNSDLQETKENLQATKEKVQEAKEQTENIKIIAESAISAATIGVGKLNPGGVATEVKNQRISRLEEGFGKATLAPITNSEDPNNGRFGGKSETNGRRLIAAIKPNPGNENYYNVQLCVASTDSQKPLSGIVRFYLHDSFREPIVDVKVKDGMAKLDPVAYGAFTVGAIADDGETLLELNLKELDHAPGNSRIGKPAFQLEMLPF